MKFKANPLKTMSMILVLGAHILSSQAHAQMQIPGLPQIPDVSLEELKFMLQFYAQSKQGQELKSRTLTQALMKDAKVSSTSEAVVKNIELIQDGSTDRAFVILSAPGLADIRLYLSGPSGFLQSTEHQYPAIFIMAGFFTGAKNTLLLGETKDQVVVGFDYPYSPEDIFHKPEYFVQTTRIVPAQAALALKWISQQSWNHWDQSLNLGISLGGLFLPSVLRIAEEMNVRSPRSVFAFTGVGIENVVYLNAIKQMSEEQAQLLSKALSALAVLSEPKNHLAFLSGKFLVLRSNQDSVFPASSTDEFFQLLPANKTEICFSGGHINADQVELIQQTKDTIAQWLKQDLTSKSCQGL